MEPNPPAPIQRKRRSDDPVYMEWEERIALTLERIATALEQSAAIAPLESSVSFLEGLLHDLQPDATDPAAQAPEYRPEASVQTVSPEDADIVDDVDFAEIPLPIAGAGIIFRMNKETGGFELWLSGPNGTITPLQWHE